MKYIKTDKAPSAVGPYSQAVSTDNLIFTSGQIGIDPESGALVEGIESQTKQVMENLKNVLAAEDKSFNDVVKTTIYLSDLKNYQIVNKIYGSYLSSDHLPARSTVQVAGLPLGALIEIEVIAVKLASSG